MDQPYTGSHLGPLARQAPPPASPDQAGDPWAAFSDTPPTTSTGSGPAGADPWAAFPDTAPAAKAPSRDIGSGEATLRGAARGLSFGTSPALSGAQDAANPDIEAAAKKFGIDPETAVSFLNHVAPGLKTAYGAGRLAVDALEGEKDTPAQKAYSKTRQKEAEDDAAAAEQHPYLYNGAEIAGSIAAPLPELGAIKIGAG